MQPIPVLSTQAAMDLLFICMCLGSDTNMGPVSHCNSLKRGVRHKTISHIGDIYRVVCPTCA